MDIEFRNLIEPDGPTPEEEYRRLASSEVPFEAACRRMMLELFDALRRDVTGPRLFAERDIEFPGHLPPGLMLLYSDGHGHTTTITVKVYYKDCSPLVEGLPLLHYRLRRDPYSRERRPDSRDELRTRHVRTACDFILEAIRDCRGPA